MLSMTSLVLAVITVPEPATGLLLLAGLTGGLLAKRLRRS